VRQRGAKHFIVCLMPSPNTPACVGSAESRLLRLMKVAKFYGIDVLDWDTLPLDVPTRTAINAAIAIGRGKDPRDEDWPKPPAQNEGEQEMLSTASTYACQSRQPVPPLKFSSAFKRRWSWWFTWGRNG
jgi:hypothetical protein